ncbi:NAD(P)-dependent oxidoreductase [Dactylosporangium sp. CS-033363]|uniref:NAD(P)-dependent oxidoreductase n=1 Tax=Dactylosporangium sp. CS-033363 TaxID=3239935 RepID=UPI003D92940A
MTRLVVFGAGGRAGRAIVSEARRRTAHSSNGGGRGGDGMTVTPVVREPAKYADLDGAVRGDATDADSVAAVAAGHDVAIVAVYSAELDPAAYAAATEQLLAGLERAAVKKVLIVGLATTFGAVDSLPAEWRPFAQARADELAVLRDYAGAVDWVVFTPPMELVEGDSMQYTMKELGGRLTYAALAAALLDEVEAGRHHRRQVGVSG